MTSMLDILRARQKQSAPNPAASNSMLGILQELDDLPAAAADPAGVPPSPAEAAPPVDPVVPVASGGRNNARVAPEPPVVADEPFDIDAQIARNNEFADRVDDLLANTNSVRPNDTTRRSAAAPIARRREPCRRLQPCNDGFDQIKEIELSRVKNVIAQPARPKTKRTSTSATISGVRCAWQLRWTSWDLRFLLMTRQPPSRLQGQHLPDQQRFHAWSEPRQSIDGFAWRNLGLMDQSKQSR